MSLVVYADEEAPVSAVDEAKLLTGQADGGGVDQGHHLFHVLREQTVEQTLVPVLPGREEVAGVRYSTW